MELPGEGVLRSQHLPRIPGNGMSLSISNDICSPGPYDYRTCNLASKKHIISAQGIQFKSGNRLREYGGSQAANGGILNIFH